MILPPQRRRVVDTRFLRRLQQALAADHADVQLVRATGGAGKSVLIGQLFDEVAGLEDHAATLVSIGSVTVGDPRRVDVDELDRELARSVTGSPDPSLVTLVGAQRRNIRRSYSSTPWTCSSTTPTCRRSRPCSEISSTSGRWWWRPAGSRNTRATWSRLRSELPRSRAGSKRSRCHRSIRTRCAPSPRRSSISGRSSRPAWMWTALSRACSIFAAGSAPFVRSARARCCWACSVICTRRSVRSPPTSPSTGSTSGIGRNGFAGPAAAATAPEPEMRCASGRHARCSSVRPPGSGSILTRMSCCTSMTRYYPRLGRRWTTC